MKKISVLFSIVLLLASSNAFAQEKTAQDRLKEIEEMTVKARKHRAAKREKLFNCDALSHFYFGFHQVSDQPQLEGKFFDSYEIGFNAIQFGLNPASWVSLQAGLDLKWDSFRINKDYPVFIMDNQYAFTTMGGLFGTDDVDHISKLEQRIRCFALAVPVALAFHTPWFSFRGGAEFDFNIDRFTSLKSSYMYKDGVSRSEVQTKEPDAKVRNLCINYFASIDFDGLGVYCKYYPKSIIRDDGIASEPGTDMKYLTLGLIFTF